jgi:hypothetical protein
MGLPREELGPLNEAEGTEALHERPAFRSLLTTGLQTREKVRNRHGGRWVESKLGGVSCALFIAFIDRTRGLRASIKEEAEKFD